MKPVLFILAMSLEARDPDARITAGIERLRQKHNVPAVSVAMIEDGKLSWARGFGGVNTETLFQSASISKPVAATAALHMMQHGNFTLDEDVNGKLKSWKVPENEFTATEKVTLRRLLSHSAGLTIGGFPGYETGSQVPTLVQILNGEAPARTVPIRVDMIPGSKGRYSGGGYTVLQQLLMDRTGWPFPQIMQRMVLSRLGMKRSTYEQPLPEALASNAAVAHDADGKPLKGRWHVYPEMAAAGLWTTPSDLALWAIEIRDAYLGKSSKVIERTTAAEMLKAQSGDFGLGVNLSRGNFSHGGSSAGYRCILVMNLESGKGAVVMTNSGNGAGLYEDVLRLLAVAR